MAHHWFPSALSTTLQYSLLLSAFLWSSRNCQLGGSRDCWEIRNYGRSERWGITKGIQLLAGGGRGQFDPLYTLSHVLSFSMHSLLHMTQQFLVATSKERDYNVHCHSFLCTFYCWLASISAKYRMIAVPSEIFAVPQWSYLYTHTPLALAWLMNIFFMMYSFSQVYI